MSFLSDIFNPIGDAFSTVGHGLYSGLQTMGQGIYDAGKWGVDQARPIIGGLAPAAGTAIGGYFGGPLGAAAGNALGSMAGNAISGGNQGNAAHQALTNAGNAYIGNNYGENQNYGRWNPAPPPQSRGRMPVAQPIAQPVAHGRMPSSGRMSTQPVRAPQRQTMTPGRSMSRDNRGYAHGGSAYAHGGRHLGSTFGGMFSHLVPEGLRNVKVGGVGPHMGGMGGRRFGEELQSRLPTGSLNELIARLGSGAGSFLHGRLPQQYAGYGDAFGQGLGALGQSALGYAGIGNKSLPEMLQLPQRGENLGRMGGGMLQGLLRPQLGDRAFRNTTLGELPGYAGGALGSALEDRIFGARHPAHHGHHGHHGHHAGNEYEGVGNLFREHHADGGMAGYADGGHVQHDYSWGSMPESWGHAFGNGMKSLSDRLPHHAHGGHIEHMPPQHYAHGGHSLRDLAEMLEMADTMGHGAH